MNTLMLTALVSATLLAPAARASTAAPVAQATIVSGPTGSPTYNELYTESSWQRILIPEDARLRLGRMTGLDLSVTGLPANVTVSLSDRSGPAGTVGLKIGRTDRTYGVYQTGTFTLTNPANGERYTFQARVNGSGR